MVSNAYAVRAREHWQTHLPNRYQQLTSPDEFFDDLGTQISQRVQARVEALTADVTGSASFLDNLAAQNMPRIQAEDEVLREMLPPPEEDIPAR